MNTRLVEDLRGSAPKLATCRDAADLIERLRGVEEAVEKLLEWVVPLAGDNCDPISAEIEMRTVADVRAAIAAYRSTGAADVGKIMGEHHRFCPMCGCECATAKDLAASQFRNRELTRQVEQLQARVDAAEKDVRRYQWLREHVKPWEGFDAGYPYCEIDIYLCELANGSVEKVSIIGPRDAVGMASLDTAVDIALSALTAPPSSSDRGRNDSKGIEGDTGREER